MIYHCQWPLTVILRLENLFMANISKKYCILQNYVNYSFYCYIRTEGLFKVIQGQVTPNSQTSGNISVTVNDRDIYFL